LRKGGRRFRIQESGVQELQNKRERPNPNSSLRAMLSRMHVVLAPEAAVSTKEFSARPSIPLCDLRDLCAMLSS
jgi:hypothetical protein